jgi:hypothetical protein
MAKYSTRAAGSSAHIHQSLRDLDDKPIFYDPEAEHGMSATMRHYMAGLLHHASEITYFLAPYINSYKRFAAGTFAPTKAIWSMDNRTAGYRVCGADTKSIRVECRVGGADLNPYLAMAALLAAGLGTRARGVCRGRDGVYPIGSTELQGSGPQHRALRAGEETRLDEERQGLALDHGATIEALHREPATAIGAHPLDERVDRGSQPVGVRLSERQQRATAALHVERRLAAREHDVRARNPCRPRAGPLRPWEGGAVRLRRVGGGEHQRLVLLHPPELAEPLDGAGERELGTAEPFDEVPAAARADGLERLQLRVDRPVSAGNPLRADAVPGDDPLPLEQELRERASLPEVDGSL